MAMRFPEDANASLAILRRGGLSGGRLVFKVGGEIVRGVTCVDLVDGQVVVRLPIAAVRLEATDMDLADVANERRPLVRPQPSTGFLD